MNKYIASSVNPNQLSTTISGLIITLSSLIILGASHFGVSLGTEEISTIATQAGIAIGAITTLYGAIRKILVAFSD